MRKPVKQSAIGIKIGVLGLIVSGWLIASWSPDNPIKELIVVAVAYPATLLIVSGMIGNRKLGVVISTGLFGMLIFNRLGILDWVSGILMLIVLGLIALVN